MLLLRRLLKTIVIQQTLPVNMRNHNSANATQLPLGLLN